jgi:murein DD-endopeptidase MepM/ murein hydrolase activator NlpD
MSKSRGKRVHNIRSILCLSVVFLLIVSMAFQSAADQLSDYQKKLQRAVSEQKEVKKQIEKTEKDLSWNKKKRDELVRELETLGLQKEEVEQQVQLLESTICSLDESIAMAEQEYNEKLDLLKRRLRVMLKKSTTVWQLNELLACKNINEFFVRVRYMQEIAENDQRLLDSVEKKKLEIEELKAQKQYEMDNCVAQVKQYMQQIEQMQVSRSALDQNIKSAQKTLKQYEEEQARLEQDSKELEELIKKYQSSNSVYRGGDLIWPMPTNKAIHSYYGNRLHPIYKVWKMHTGIDIGAAWDEHIVAAGDGIVIFAGTKSGYGNTVIIDHGGGITTLYAHINKRGILVSAGQEVKAGQVIGKAGMTGTATGPHLHFEVRKNGKHQNPLEYVPKP